MAPAFLQHQCDSGSAATVAGAACLAAAAATDSSEFCAGSACFACAGAWPVVASGCEGDACVGVSGAVEAGQVVVVAAAVIVAVVIVGAGLLGELTVVMGSLFVCQCSGPAGTDHRDMAVTSGPLLAYWYQVEHPV